MLKIIPAIDLLNGQVVRLRQGVYTDVSHFSYDPVILAKQFEEQGAKRIHIVDLDGAKNGKLVNQAIIQEIRKNVNCELELGGGIRSIENAKNLIELGLDYLIIGSLLIENFELSNQIIERFPNRIIAGIDAKSDIVATNGWESSSNVTISTIIQKINNLPLSAIIYTDIEKDGMMSGPNIEAIKSVLKLSTHKVIASGGISSIKDIKRLKEIDKIYGCIIGKAILANHISLKEFINYA